MGWCHDLNSRNKYNKLINLNLDLSVKNYSDMIINMISLFP